MQTSVKSQIEIHASPETVWGLLCDAKLPLTAPCCFKIGVPTPERCTLVSEKGVVGAKRQCQTRQGIINQEITEWLPPQRLSFNFESSTLGLEKHIASMSDTFVVVGTEHGSRLSRQTDFSTRGLLAVPKAILFKISIWHIHRYVMRNFRVLAEERASL